MKRRNIPMRKSKKLFSRTSKPSNHFANRVRVQSQRGGIRL